MNKRRFCILYNEAKAQWVVVRETVLAKGAACYRGCISMLLGSAILAPTLCAQVAPAPEAPGPKRPVVDSTGNGRPLVQITAPNAAGLSNNHYTQFNVDGNGLILNNATGTVLTQQGGYVAGNPFLAGGSARIILNQVTGTQLSQLTGYLEVAGTRADVILANPNGIVCNGGGFINTNRGVLTTGTPILEANGSLGGFLVRAGQIEIGGKGLNASNLDQLDLIARSLKVNGQIWSGDRLNVITGANQVDFSGLGLQVLPGRSGKPKVGIDVAKLGGMYAKRIHLIGTEAGVGVNSKGTMAAQAGDFTCTSQGRIIHTGRTTAAGNLALSAQDGLFNSGTLYSQGQASVSSAGLVENRGLLASRGDFALRADRLGSTGTLAAGLQEDGQLLATGELTLATKGELNATGSNSAGGDLRFTGASLGMRGASTNAGGNATLAATAGQLDHSGATLQAGGAFSATAPRAVVNDQGRISAQQVSVDSASLSNREGAINQGGLEKTSLVVTGAMDNTGGTIHSNAPDLFIRSQSLSNDQEGRIQQAGMGTLDLQTGELSNAQGVLASNGQVQVKADSLVNRAGSLTAQGDLTVAVQGDLDNAEGLIQAGGMMHLTGVNLSNDAGQILTLNGNGLNLSVSSQLRNGAGTTATGAPGGVISSQGDASVHAGSIVNSGTLVAGLGLNATADGAWDNQLGSVTAGQAMQVQAASLSNAQGQFSALQVTLAVPELHNDEGRITAESLSLAADNLTNQGGQVTHLGAGPVTVTVTQALDNSGGRIQTGQADLSLTPQVLANRAGTIASNGSLRVTADRIENSGGTLSARQQANLTATQAGIDNGLAGNQGGTIVAEQLSLVAKTGLLRNQGQISADHGVSIDVQDLNNDGGRLETRGPEALAVTVAQGVSNQRGFMGGTGKVGVTAGSLDNSHGTLRAGVDLEVQANAGLGNTGGALLAAGNLTARAGGALTNGQGGRIEAGGPEYSASTLDLTAAAIDNREGRIANAGTGALTLGNPLATQAGPGLPGQGLDNGQGFIGGNGEVRLAVMNLDNAAGLLTTPADLTVTARAAIGNRQGTIEAGGALSLAGSDLANDAGRILALGEAKLSVTASGQLRNTPGASAASPQGGVIRGNGAVTVNAGSLHNAATLAASQGLTVKTEGTLDNSGGTLQAGHSLEVQSSADLVNTGGTLLAAGNLKASAVGALGNSRGRIETGAGEGAASSLELTAASIENGEGRILNAGTGATTLTGSGRICNSSPAGNPDLGVIAGKGDVTVRTAELHNNQNGRLLASGDLALEVTRDLDNAGGTVHAQSTLTMNQPAATLSNQGGELGAAGAVTLSLAKLDNARGTLASEAGLNVTAGSIDNSGGLLSAQQGATLTATQGDLHNGLGPDRQGTIAADQLTLAAPQGQLCNQGLIQASHGVTVKVQNLDNDGGRLQTTGRDLLTVTAAERVVNHSKGFIGGQGDVAVRPGSLENNDGELWAGANLEVTAAEQLRNVANAQITAGGAGGGAHRLTLSALSIDNADGRIANAGTGATTLTGTRQVSNSHAAGVKGTGIVEGAGKVTIHTPELHNTQGGVISGHGMTVGVQALNNDGGHLQSEGSEALNVTAARSVSNQKGFIGGQGRVQVEVTAGSLDNSHGTLIASGDLELKSSLDLVNTGGALAVDGNLKAAVGGVLTNTAGGRIEAGGPKGSASTLDLTATRIDNSSDGRIVNSGSGAMTLTGNEQVYNSHVSVINGAGKVTIDTPELHNTEGGKLIAQGDLDLKASDVLNTGKGILHAQGKLELNRLGAVLRNSGGQIGAEGEVRLNLGELHNTQDGVISGQGKVEVKASSVENNHGTLQAGGDLDVTADAKLDNTGGLMRSNASLKATTGGILTNTGKAEITSGGAGGGSHRLTLSAASLDNADGRIVNGGRGDTSLTGTKEILNSGPAHEEGKGIIAGAGKVTIDAPRLHNTEGGKLIAQGDLDLKASDVLNTGKGILHAQGKLELNRLGAILRNSGGQIGAEGEVSLTLGELHNTQDGVISGQGKVEVKASSVENNHGTLQAGGDLDVTGHAKLDNSGGSMRSNANLEATTDGILTNTGNAQITAGGAGGGEHRLTLSAASLNNADGRIINAGQGDTSLTGIKEIRNRRVGQAEDRGIIGGAGKVTIKAPELHNTEGGKLIAQGVLDLKTGSLDNSRGTLQATGDLDLTADAKLDNTGGSMRSNASLKATTGGLLTNTGKAEITAGGAGGGSHQLTLSAASLDNADGRIVNAGKGDTSLTGSKEILNSGPAHEEGKGIIGGAGKVTIDAPRLHNTEGGKLIAQGDLDLKASDVLNTGKGILHAQGKLELNRLGAVLRNSGGQIGAEGEVRLNLGELHNTQDGVISGQGKVEVKASSVENNHGTLQAGGDLDVTGHAKLDNSGGSMRSNANLEATTDGILTNTGNAQITAGGAGGGEHRLTLSAASLNNADGRIINAGQGDTSLTGIKEIRNRRVGQAEYRGIIGGAGKVTIKAPELHNTEGGKLIAQGILDLKTGSLDNSRGTLQATGDLDVTADAKLDNTGGSMRSNASLKATTGGILTNTGKAEITAGGAGGGSHQLTLSAASLDNADGRIVNAGTGVTTLTATGQITNSGAGGVEGMGMIGGAGKVTVHAPDLQNTTGGKLVAQSNLDLKISKSLNNAGGTLHAQGNLNLEEPGNSLSNPGGTLGAVGDITLKVLSLDNNERGVIANALTGKGTLQITTTGDLNNAAGKIAGNASLVVTADQKLHNVANGILRAEGPLAVTAGHLDTRNGALQAVGDLTLTSKGAWINTGGVVQGNASVKATAAGDLGNGGGRIEAGGAKDSTGALEVTAARIDNRNGRIVNAGTGGTQIKATTQITNGNDTGSSTLGTLGGNGNVTIDTPHLQNQKGGQVLATHNLSLITPNRLDNLGAKLFAGGNLELKQAAATLNNRADGEIGATGNVTVEVSLLENAGGRIRTTQGGGDVAIKAGNRVGNQNGTLASGRVLNLETPVLVGRGTIAGELGAHFKTNANLWLGGKTPLTSNQDMSYITTGNLTVAGDLKAPGTLTLRAASIQNTKDGMISAATTVLRTPGQLFNAGRIYGDHIALEAAGFTNQYTAGVANPAGSAGAVGAMETLNIGAPLVRNEREATIYSLKSMAIGRELDGNHNATGQADSIFNNGAVIKTEYGNMQLNAKEITNKNRKFNAVPVLVSSEKLTVVKPYPNKNIYDTYLQGQVYDNNGLHLFPSKQWPKGKRITGHEYLRYEITRTTHESQVEHSEPAQIISGGDLLLSMSGGKLKNDKSYMQARNLNGIMKDIDTDPANGSTTTKDHGDLIQGYNSRTGAQVRTLKRNTTFSVTNKLLPLPIERKLPLPPPAREKSGKHSTPLANPVPLPGHGAGVQSANGSGSGATPGPLAGSPKGINTTPSIASGTSPIAAVPQTTAVVQPSHSIPGGTSPLAEVPGTTAILQSSPSIPGGTAHMAQGPQAIAIVQSPFSNPGGHPLPQPSGRPGHSSGPFTRSGASPAAGVPLTPPQQRAQSVNGPGPIPGFQAHPFAIGPAPFMPAASAAVPGAAPLGGQARGVVGAPAPTPEPTAPRPVNLGPGIVPGAAPVAVPAQAVGSAAATLPNLTLPTALLYQIHSAPEHPYLVEGHPDFTRGRVFESSDYMLRRLAMNPEHTHKRLGDGFYETQHVSRQVNFLTGRTFLQGSSNFMEQFMNLMDNGVACAQSFGLEPGIALTGEQMAALTRDIVWMVNQEITLKDGQRTQVLAPVVYLSRANAALPRPTGSVISAETVNLKLTGTLDNGGTLRADRQMLVSATDIRNSGALTTVDQDSILVLRAANDLSNGGSLQGSDVKLFAGRDLNLQTSTLTTAFPFGSATSLGPVASVQAGSLLAVSGRDLNLGGAQIQTTGDALLKAGGDLTFGAVTTGSSLRMDFDARNHLYESSTQVNGSKVATGGNLFLLAGKDLTATAAELSAGQDLRAKAGGNLTLNSADATSHSDIASYHTSKGFLNSSSHESRTVSNSRTAVGTIVSGNRVHLEADQDLAVIGSIVSGTKGVRLEAEGDVQILAATSTEDLSSFSRQKESGLMTGGGFGFTIGSKEQTDKFDRQSKFQSQNRSLVGSEEGDLTILAKGKAKVSGSDLLAGQDFLLQAKSAVVGDGRDDSTSQESHDFVQRGVTVALNSPVTGAVQTVQAMENTASQSKDARVRALAAATGGLAVANAASSMKKANGGISASVSATYGTSKSHSEASQSSSVSSGSRVSAGRHSTIITTEGDLSVIGSDIHARENLNLGIAGKLNVLASVDSQDYQSHSTSSSASAGVAANVGQGGASFGGFTASFSKGKGNTNGSDRAHNNSHLSAGQKVTINTGGDATFRGGVVTGEQIKGKIGGDLILESLQDTSTYRSEQQSVSVGATMGAGASVSGSFQSGKIRNDFASVREQAGIHAGDGGFQLEVAGHTDLKGAVITSSDRAVADNLNSLQMATIAFSDLDNHAESSASAVGLSVNLSKGAEKEGAPPPSWKPGAGAPSALATSASAGSTTRSGISGAAITITDSAQQLERSGQAVEATLAGLNQTVRTGQDNGHALTNSFDAQELQIGLNVVQAFGQEAGTFLAIKAAGAAATAEQVEFELAKEKQKPEPNRDPAKLDQLTRELEAAKTWAPGGTSRQLASAFTAAVSGNVGASTTQLLQGALVNYIQQKGAAYIGELVHGTKDQPGVLKEGSPEHAALHAIVAAGGAMASGQDVLSGASGAAASSLMTRLFAVDPELPIGDKETKRDLMTALVAGMAGVLDLDAGTAAGAAHNTLDNNALTTGNSFGGVASSLGDAWRDLVSDPIERLNNKLRGVGWVEDRHLQDELNLIAATDPARAQKLADQLNRDQFIASLPLISCGGLAPVGVSVPTFTFQVPGGPSAPAVATNGSVLPVSATSAVTTSLPSVVVTMAGSGGRQKQEPKSSSQTEPKKEPEASPSLAPGQGGQKNSAVRTHGEYKPAPYHGKVDNSVKSRAPINGQEALDSSVQVKPTSPRRVGIDKLTNEIVVFDKTVGNTYHGHVRSWDALHQDMKNALIKSGLVDKSGKVRGGG